MAPLPLPQSPVPPKTDLRDMLRQHLVTRALACMDRAARRRDDALACGDVAGYQQTIRRAVRGFYGALPAGADAPGPEVTPVSSYDKTGYRIENVLFDSFPGWQVNATV